MTESKMVQVVISASPLARSWPPRASKAIRVNTTEARPRGPNQPMKPTVSARSRVPNSEIATGTIRTRVRLTTT